MIDPSPFVEPNLFQSLFGLLCFFLALFLWLLRVLAVCLVLWGILELGSRLFLHHWLEL
jgi:hypothetical protein